MFYLRELLNGCPSMEIYVPRPSLFKKCPKGGCVRFLLKKGVAGHMLVDTQQYFVSLEKKMVLALTLFIIIVKELELDEFQIVVVQVFLHFSFMIYDVVTSWMSKMNDRHHIWLSSLTEILTEEEDSREIFAVNIELCIFWLFFVLTNKINKLVKVVIWGRNCYYIWENKTISRSLTLSLVVFLPLGLCIWVSCDVLDVHNVLAYWLIVIGGLKSEAALFQT